jgi:glutathione synthase/RimK-type ligase-like ATP-grasp enzyme
VLKIPDGSFSRGVIKVDDLDQLAKAAAHLFQSTALLIAQEFLYTEFDWRIGVLNRKPLYACKYFMSRGHWQIYNHSARGSARSGGFECMKIDDAPAEVVRLAVRGSSAIGNGLYGVDIKQTHDRTVLIEVNDNPSIDASVEDAELGEELYQRIMRELLRRMEAKRNGVAA